MGQQFSEVGLTDAELRATPVPVVGEFSATLEGGATEVTLAAVLVKLADILAELNQKYEGGAIALDVGTLAALESVSASISNFPVDYPLPAAQVTTLTPQTDALTDGQLRAVPVQVTVTNPTTDPETGLATQATLAALLTELGQKLEPGGEVALDAATLAALESITVTVSNPTANPETGLATQVTLAAILTELGEKYEGGAVALDAATLAALETITASISNLPADYPLPAGQVTTLTPQTNALTDAELRAAVVPVGDGGGSLTVDGTVGLNSAVSNFVSPTTSLKVGQGRFFIASTGKVTLTAAGHVRLTFSNPAASGKTISLVRVGSFCTNGPAWATLFINPTAGLPASSARPALNAIVGGGNTAVGELKADTSLTTALSGGTDTGIVIPIESLTRVQIDMPPLVLAPGVTLGIEMPFTGSAQAEAAFYFIED